MGLILSRFYLGSSTDTITVNIVTTLPLDSAQCVAIGVAYGMRPDTDQQLVFDDGTFAGIDESARKNRLLDQLLTGVVDNRVGVRQFFLPIEPLA
jgi:hypothetical protein